MGREPFRQFPGKWSSDIVWTVDADNISWRVPLRVGGTDMGMGRTILQMHLHCRPIGRFADPYVEIFPFPCLEEQYVVAIVELG